MPDKKYCYKDSDILINKFDIRDVKKLKLAERKLTMLRLLELFDDPIEGRFDLAHLQNIHRYIFQDIYEWSGEIRTIDNLIVLSAVFKVSLDEIIILEANKKISA